MSASHPFHIRVATIDDVPALNALIEASVRGLQAGDYTPAQIDGALGHALGLDTQLIEDATYFVAEDASGTIVACGGWSFRQKLCGSDGLDAVPGCGSASSDPTRPSAKIRAIFVHPARSRKGLGTLLLAHCEQQARAAGFTHAEMGSTLTGVPLYSLRGYHEQERMFIPLPNGESLPVVKMTKTL